MPVTTVGSRPGIEHLCAPFLLGREERFLKDAQCRMMEDFVELTDRQRRIIDAKHEYENNGGSICSIASAHQIPFSALQRAVKTNATSFSIVAASKGRGKKAKTQYG